MSVLDDFYTTDSIQLDPVGLNLVESPHLVIVGVPTPDPLIPAGPLPPQTVPCVSKTPGRLNATLTILGITIRFDGTFLGVDSGGRWLVRWSADDRARQPFMGATITRVHGQFTVAIASLAPVRTDLITCTGASSEFFVSVSLIPLSTLEDRFRMLPDGQIAENEIRIETTLTTPIRALITSIQGNAGVAAPSPTSWPQPVGVTLNAYCLSWSRFTRRVFG